MKSEASKWLDIYLSNTRSVGEPVFSGWNHLQFDPAEK